MTLDTDLDGHRHEVTTVRITGMTCAACERRVTRALAGLPGVDSVTASATSGRATLTGTAPSDDAVRAALEAAGYHLGAPPWITRDRQAWTTAAVSAVAVAALGWLALRLGVHGPATDDGSGRDLAGSVALALLVGLAAGVSTCMALVGGLVLGVSASQAERHAQDRTSGGPGRLALIRPHLVFTAGRLAGFALGGVLLGAVGSAARLPGPVVAGAGVAAAAVMALLGVRLTGLSPRMSGWALSLPGGWGDRVGIALGRSSGVGIVGAATFLLPCGFTQAMQVYAISLGSPGAASATMTAFAAGTVPGLLGLGALGSVSGRSGRRDRSAAAVRPIGVVVLAFALVTGIGGLRASGLGLPRLGGGTATQAAPTTASPNVQVDGDVQIVTLTQSADGYTPANTVVWAGMPIRWTVDVTAAFSCSTALRVPSLGVAADLTTKGRHVVDVPALKVGTTSFTCVMGMYGGTFRAIPRPTPAAPASPSPQLSR